ncbi:MAG: hypothetical protein HC932_03870 [Thermales bacterium]|nr:hypothetical protein [Thermales bacterium]
MTEILSNSSNKKFDKPILKQHGSLSEVMGLKSQLNDNERKFLDSTYPKILDCLKDEKLGGGFVESILYKIKMLTADPGLERDSKFILENGEEISAQGTPVLSRSGFVHKVLESLSEKTNEKKLTVLIFDIANLRQADLVKDNSQANNSYADIILNQTASTVDNLVKEFREENTDEDFEIEFGRYGGDEFVVGITGNLNDEKKTELARRIKLELSQIEGKYVQANGEVEHFVPIRLKGGGAERIDLPTDPIFEDIFLHYFQRGLIFDQNEIEKTLSKFNNEKGNIDIDKLQNFYKKEDQDYHIYPTDVETTKDKANFILKKNKELGLIILVAIRYDKLNNTNTVEGVLNIIENIIFDPLLREHILTFTEIYNKIESGRVGQLYTFDLRFIKEINDNLGLVSGDMAIKETWNQLRNKIDSQDEGYISFGRRGGTFYLVVDKGYILSEQTMQAIDSFSHSNILSDENHETQSVPIGCASVSFGDDIIEKEELKKCIDILYEKTNEDWSLKILEDLAKLNLKEAKNSQQLTKDSLVYKFFTGKRRIERQNAIKKIIFDKYKNNIQVFQSLMTTIASLDIE